MLSMPMLFCFILLALPFIRRDWKQVSFLILTPLMGICVHFILQLCRRRDWLAFARDPPQGVEELLAMQTPMAGHKEAPILPEPFELPANQPL